MIRDALISDCGQYRYWLSRIWDPSLPLIVWVMLNPSTADAKKDDPTIRKCIGFSKRWGFGGLVVVNLYALRATVPQMLWKHADPVGPENDYWIQQKVSGRPVILAWGANAAFDREEPVRELVERHAVQREEELYKPDVRVLGNCQNGSPRHPLRLKYTTPLRVPAWV